MKNHVFRPLFVVIGLVVIVLIARFFYVPSDFGSHERGYMYGWHRKANEDEWKAVKVKFQGREYCKDCHSTQYSQISVAPHAIIQCENCHGPAIDHPSDPPKLTVDRSRDLCIRCHSYLPYPTTVRGKIKGINPNEHNPGIECSMCHNPHKASKPI